MGSAPVGDKDNMGLRTGLNEQRKRAGAPERLVVRMGGNDGNGPEEAALKRTAARAQGRAHRSTDEAPQAHPSSGAIRPSDRQDAGNPGKKALLGAQGQSWGGLSSSSIGRTFAVQRTNGAHAAMTMTNDWKMAVTKTLATISKEFIRLMRRLRESRPSIERNIFLAV